MEHLDALSPLDDRYRPVTEALLPFFSERAFFHYRAVVELHYLTAFIETVGIYSLSVADKNKIHQYADLSQQDYQHIKSIENRTHHDLKALEYYLREKIDDARLTPYIHLGLTSEDASNIAYSQMISHALTAVFHPTLEGLNVTLLKMSQQYRAAPILTRTPGQPASLTTFGK